MITIYERFNIQAQALPYAYQFSSSVPDCITFDNGSGFSSSSLLTTAIIGLSSCIDGATINLLIVDANGCRENITFTLTSPCNTFTLTDIARNGYTFSAEAINPACQGTTINWSYDTNHFTEVQVSTTLSGSTIELLPNDNVTITDSPITATAIDCNGCVLSKQTFVTVCRPRLISASNSTITCGTTSAQSITYGRLIPCNNGLSGFIDIFSGLIEITPGPGVATTLLALYVSPTTGVISGFFPLAQPAQTGVSYFVKIRIRESLTSPWSNEITKVIVGTGDCLDNGDTNISQSIVPDQHYEMAMAGAMPGDIWQIPVDQNIFNTQGTNESPVDYGLFMVHTSPAPLSNDITLARDLEGNLFIRYVVPNPVPTRDLFSWTIGRQDGTMFRSGNVTIFSAVPSPVANPVSSCAVVDSTKTIPLSFTTSRLMDPNSITLSNVAALPAVIAKDGLNVKYTPTRVDNTLGNKVFSFMGQDTEGRTSTTNNVTVTVISAGIGTTTNLCTPYTLTPSTVTPYNYITGPKTATGTWTKTSETGPTAPSTATGSINLSTYGAGTYSYRYTVTNGTCTDNTTVNFVVQAHSPVANDTCATAQTISFGGADRVSTVELLTNKATCPGLRPPTMSTVALPSAWSLGTYNGDLWYEFTAPYQEFGLSYPITVTVSGSSYGQELGIKAPAIAVYRGDCPGFTLEKAVASNELNQTASVTISFGTLNTNQKFFIRVSSIGGYEGLYNLRISGVADFVTSNLNSLNTPIV